MGLKQTVEEGHSPSSPSGVWQSGSCCHRVELSLLCHRSFGELQGTRATIGRAGTKPRSCDPNANVSSWETGTHFAAWSWGHLFASFSLFLTRKWTFLSQNTPLLLPPDLPIDGVLPIDNEQRVHPRHCLRNAVRPRPGPHGRHQGRPRSTCQNPGHGTRQARAASHRPKDTRRSPLQD